VRAREADRPLHRIGRQPNPFVWPDWLRAGEDRTFGNRWDDPRGVYRVIYAASSRLGAFVEVFARFRPDPHVARELAEIRGDAGDALPPGCIERSWCASRRIGSASVRGTFVEIGHSESLAELHAALAPRLRHYRIRELDGAAIRLRAPRRLTQEISRYVYERTTARGARAFDGISYLSRLGDEFRNWALFEPVGRAQARAFITRVRSAPIDVEHPDFRRALALLRIRLAD
jgi:hypothetical protein